MSRILLGTFLSFLFLQESVFEKLDGYKFPVYSIDLCPKNETEWKTRSTLLNCTEKNGYTCLPNEHFTGLLEFCYTDPHILIEQGLCLYLIKSNSLVHGYKCNEFPFGCPTSSYLSSKIYNYPGCLLVKNGCFYAEPTCKRKINTSDRKTTKQIDMEKMYPNGPNESKTTYLLETRVYVQRGIDTTDDRKGLALFNALLPVSFLIVVLTIVIIIRRKKKQHCIQTDDIEFGKQIKSKNSLPAVKKLTPVNPKEDDQNCRDKNHTAERRQSKENYPLIAKNQRTSEEGTDEHTEERQLPVYSPSKEASTNNQKIESKCTRYAVAAIDFGTDYSAYAYSWKSEWNRIRVNESWNSGYFLSSKTSTSILLNPNQSFLAFGYDAEYIYSLLAENDLRDDEEQITKEKINNYYFFQKFKVILHEPNLHLESVVEDITGKEIKAIRLVSLLIQYFKKLLLEAMNRSIAEGEVSETDIDFVLAVPANCADGARLFMCEAAKKAGIKIDQLTIVYEGEAVSCYCQHMHLDNPFYCHTKDTLDSILQKGKKYMVVDLGGRSVDIAFHERAEDGTLEKLFPLTKETSEGISVDDEYEKFMENIGGKGILKSFAKDYMEDYLIMRRDFETKKRESSCTKVYIRIPQSFDDLMKKLFKGGIKEALKSSIYKDSVTYDKYKLCLSHEEFNTFFQKTILNTLNCIEENLQNTDVKVIIMVGGLADCEIIRNSLLERFENYQIVTPDKPGLAVLKGAVYLGHFPNTKQSKVQCFTYT